jgi:hypothetical protein
VSDPFASSLAATTATTTINNKHTIIFSQTPHHQTTTPHFPSPPPESPPPGRAFARRNLTPPPETVALLLSHFTSPPTAEEQKQAFLDAPNEYGNTGLHWAALGGHLAAVQLLVEAGASVALANDKNYVPLDLASFGEKFDVVDYFLEKSGGLEDENAEDGGLEGAVEGVTLTEKDLEEVGGDGEGKGKGKETEGSSS